MNGSGDTYKAKIAVIANHILQAQFQIRNVFTI